MNQFFKSLPILCLFTLVGAQYGNPGNSGSSTTMTSSSLPSSTTTSATGVQTVTVGASGLTFSPDTLTVSPGGKVEFHFQPGHSVTQSSFANPCHPLSDTSLSSGIVSSSNGGPVSRLPIEHFHWTSYWLRGYPNVVIDLYCDYQRYKSHMVLLWSTWTLSGWHGGSNQSSVSISSCWWTSIIQSHYSY